MKKKAFSRHIFTFFTISFYFLNQSKKVKYCKDSIFNQCRKNRLLEFYAMVILSVLEIPKLVNQYLLANYSFK